MQILNNLFGGQLDNYSRAMDRASQRQGLLTNNLANANVPGYKRKDIDFSIALNSATSGLTSGPGSVAGLNSSGQGEAQIDEGEIRIDGNSVDVEKEAMAITETEYRYQMLTQMTSNYFTGINSVIQGAK